MASPRLAKLTLKAATSNMRYLAEARVGCGQLWAIWMISGRALSAA